MSSDLRMDTMNIEQTIDLTLPTIDEWADCLIAKEEQIWREGDCDIQEWMEYWEEMKRERARQKLIVELDRIEKRDAYAALDEEIGDLRKVLKDEDI